ncbi:hypothetical protein CANARDRAFT_187771, partial [[Candida] arabinofermentans NRRL YB-2248]
HTDDIPINEQAIYDQLTSIRHQLSLIKKDHKTYINSKDINSIYNDVLIKIQSLNKIRNNDDGSSINNNNKVDILIDEIFQLLSLCFVTCGLSNTAPATYASLSTVQRLLEHLNESNIYTHYDLKPIKERLNEINNIILNDFKVDKEINLLKIKLDKAYNEYNYLENKINKLPNSIQIIMNQLISFKNKLIMLITNNNTNDYNLIELNQYLNEIKLNCENLFNSIEINDGEGLLKGLIDDCHNLLNDLQLDSIKIDSTLLPIYNNLQKLKLILENLLVTRRWTLRTTDIFNYQKELNSIDNLRINGYFFNNKSLKGQIFLIYLLRRCYAIIYKLLESSEPVSESLQPLHNQLTTIKNCLLNLKRMGGVSSIRELYPYQLKLNSVDNLRIDGKFMIGDQIPEGQGTLNALLAENFDILHELNLELENQESNNNTE